MCSIEGKQTSDATCIVITSGYGEQINGHLLSQGGIANWKVPNIRVGAGGETKMNIEVNGERWFSDEGPFKEDMKKVWGDWGINSEIGKLRAVMMRRPGPECENLEETYNYYRWKAPMDMGLARDQHDQLAQIYRDHGVEVHYVEEMGPYPNAIFTHDLMKMTPEGAIIARPATVFRRGEEKFIAQALMKLGVPIIKTVNGRGTFEGACLMWLDKDAVLLGTGNRCNEEGARQVEAELRNMGVEHIKRIGIWYGGVHIDGDVNIADKDVAVVFPWKIPHDVVVFLMDRGYRIVEMNSIEEHQQSGINFVALEPGKIVMPNGSPRFRSALEKAGVEVIELDVDELKKGWGAIHCMTAYLRRDDI
jgi:N-dimethylarginine dimethylaminohydrolase